MATFGGGMGIPDGRRTKSKKQNSRGKEHFQGLKGPGGLVLRSLKCVTVSDEDKELRGEVGREQAAECLPPTASPHPGRYQEPQKGLSRPAI